MKVEPNQMKRKAEKSFEFLFVLLSTVVSYSTLVQELMAGLGWSQTCFIWEIGDIYVTEGRLRNRGS